MVRSSWLRPMALKPMRSILMRDNRRKGDKTPKKAETGAVEPQATECQQPQEAGGGEEQILPLSFQSQPFGARPFQDSKKQMSLVFATKFVVICYSSLRKPTHIFKNIIILYHFLFCQLLLFNFFVRDSFANFSRNLLT